MSSKSKLYRDETERQIELLKDNNIRTVNLGADSWNKLSSKSTYWKKQLCEESTGKFISFQTNFKICSVFRKSEIIAFNFSCSTIVKNDHAPG